jgi:hypothetical protein
MRKEKGRKRKVRKIDLYIFNEAIFGFRLS